VGGGSSFEQFLDFVPDAIVGVGRDGQIVFANQRAEELFGYERTALLGEVVETLVPARLRDIHGDHREAYFESPRTRPMGVGAGLSAVHRDGTEFPVEISLAHIEMDGKTVATAAIRDIGRRAESEREKALRDQLDRARRLESVGQLAGGIAHDFNNILGVIMNYAEFVADELAPDSKAQEDVEEIRRAAERAAALTRQLLIFSRREVVKPEVLDLACVVGDLENLLRRALGERIEMTVRIDSELRAVEVDPSQIEQVLVNLAVNGRDAMPKGGRLTIEAENVDLDEEYAYMHPDTEPGRYVRLKVSDTGVGMSRETIDRAFDPFFTTKSDGTGLGLAAVYGIVTGAGGRVDVYSEPGFGATIQVQLPAAG
jgi:PAS domain S-box-containing protein